MTTPARWAGLELRHLLALHAIAEHGSFHKAAARLDYTQSGVSQQIAALERIVGERLLVRPGGSRPVRLTAAGHVLLRHARTIFGQISGAQREVAALCDGRGGALRVGAFQSVSASILPSLLRRLGSDRPALAIELTQGTADTELFGLLDEDRLDITFATLPIPGGPLVALELFTEPLVLMASSDSAWAARGGSVSLDELVGVPLISATHACRHGGSFESQLRERGLVPVVAHRSDDTGTVQGLVAAGVGIAVVPRLMAEPARGDIAIIGIDERLQPRRVALSWRSDSAPSPARDAFIDTTAKVCAGLGLDCASTDQRRRRPRCVAPVDHQVPSSHSPSCLNETRGGSA